MTYAYAACGLSIDSDCPLPLAGMVDRTGRPDISIRSITAPLPAAAELAQVGPFSCASPGHFRMKVPGIVEFSAHQGTRIDYISLGDTRSAAAFLMGTAFPVLMAQRGHLVLDATAVVSENQALVLVGPSVSGKSSVAASMQASGYEILSDGFCVIDEQARVLALSPDLKLWREAADELQIDLTTASPVREGFERFLITSGESPRDAAPLTHIVALEAENTDTPRFERAQGMAAFEILRHHTMQNHALGPMGLLRQHLDACSRTTKTARFARAFRPTRDYPIAAFAEDVLQFLETGGAA